MYKIELVLKSEDDVLKRLRSFIKHEAETNINDGRNFDVPSSTLDDLFVFSKQEEGECYWNLINCLFNVNVLDQRVKLKAKKGVVIPQELVIEAQEKINDGRKLRERAGSLGTLFAFSSQKEGEDYWKFVNETMELDK